METHHRYAENKVARDINLLGNVKPFLDKESSLAIYYSYIHCYLNLGNSEWVNSNRANLKKT